MFSGAKQGSMTIYLGGEVIENKDKIIVKGKSNLIPGARLDGVVIVDEKDVISSTTEEVDKKGNFTMELDHHKYGGAEVFITFDFVNSLQDIEVIEHYGEGGEQLEGPFVYVDDHWEEDHINKKAEARVQLRSDDDTKKYTIQEPDWEKQPDDYGEPRVWFELDDIENDGDSYGNSAS